MRLGIVVLDTLRYDVAVDQMSQLFDLADHEFENLYSTGRWTSPAHASLFTGYYPTEVGVHAGQRHLTTPKPTLAEQLRGEGYRTVAASNNINIDRFFDFDRGFDTFHRGPGIEDRPEKNVEGMNWGELEKKIADSGLRRPIEATYRILRSDAPLLPTLKTGIEMFLSHSEDSSGIEWSRETFERLSEEQPDDLFLFVNFMPCHYPYDPPDEYFDQEPVKKNPVEMTFQDEPVTAEEHERYWSGYVGAARYLDDALPELLDHVDWDCLFVIGDHGELFDEYEMYGHQYGVYQELTHVPALAYGSAVPEGRTSTPTSILDIHRTMLELAGVDFDTDQRGVNLFESIHEDRFVYAESEGCEWYSPNATGIEAKIPTSWVDPHYMIRSEKGVFIKDKDGQRAFSPTGKKPKPQLKESLESLAKRIRKRRVDARGDSERRGVPEEVQNRLKQLGYH